MYKKDAYFKTTSALWVLLFIWFAIAGFAIWLWAFPFGLAIALCALSVFYHRTLKLKKQQVYAPALYVLGILGIIGSGLSLALLTYEGGVNIILYASPYIVVAALMVLSLIFNIRLVQGTSELRRESAVQPVFPEQSAADKPMHLTSLILGILSVALSLSGFIFCFVGTVCGVTGLILAIRSKHEFKSKVGKILSIIGIVIGSVFIIIFVSELLLFEAGQMGTVRF